MVMKPNRATWKIAADLSGDNRLFAVARDGRHLGRGLGLSSSPINPSGDFSAVVIVGLVVDVGIGGEKREEVSKFSVVGGVEECGDNRR